MLKRMSVGPLLCDPYKSKAGWTAAGSVDADLSLLHFFELQRTDVAEGRRPLGLPRHISMRDLRRIKQQFTGELPPRFQGCQAPLSPPFLRLAFALTRNSPLSGRCNKEPTRRGSCKLAPGPIAAVLAGRFEPRAPRNPAENGFRKKTGPYLREADCPAGWSLASNTG